MVPEDVRKLNISLTRYLSVFEDCFRNRQSYQNFQAYVEGQVSSLNNKNVRQIALFTGTNIRTLQGFLEAARWDEQKARDNVQSYVRRKHTGEENIGIVDGTYHAKNGTNTVGVKRQWDGRRGKIDNCVVSVNLSYLSDGFHTIIDSSLFLPEEWINDDRSREEAGIPESVSYRTKQEIALAQIRRARRNGVCLDWMSFDEAYGKSPLFLEGLEEMPLPYAGEIPETATGWLTRPEVIKTKEQWEKRGPKPDFPVVSPEACEPRSVEEIYRKAPVFQNQEWRPVHVKNTRKGPQVWEVKTAEFYHNRSDCPSEKRCLLVARHPFTDEVKYILVHNPNRAELTTLLRVAFSRTNVEKCFRDGKQEIGLDDFEVRNYRPVKRHLLISLVSYLFISEQTDRLQESNSNLTKPQVKLAVDVMIEGLELSSKERKKRIDEVCERIRQTQKQNNRSYRSHRKRRIGNLEEEGYDINEMLSCIRKLE